jgi:hypothetical protein
MLERWVAGWEVDFYRSLSSEKKAEHLKEAAREISNLLSMVGEFRRRLTAFEHARYATTDKTWFPSASDRADAPGELFKLLKNPSPSCPTPFAPTSTC